MKNLRALNSIGSFINTSEGTFHPMNADGSPDLSTGCVVSVLEADLRELDSVISKVDSNLVLAVYSSLIRYS